MKVKILPSWLYVDTFFALKHFWGTFFASCYICRTFWSFFCDLRRSILDFGTPSWPYVGTFFALGRHFCHKAGIAARQTCWHSLSAFRFHIAAWRYVRSTWIGPKCSPWALLGELLDLFLKALEVLWGKFWLPGTSRASIWEGLGTCQAGFSQVFGTSYMMFLWMWSLCICIPVRCSLPPLGAAVCAQHIRRLPKGEPCVPDIYCFHPFVPASKACIKTKPQILGK